MSSYDLFIGRHSSNASWTDAMTTAGGEGVVLDHWEPLAAKITDRSMGRFTRFDDDDTVDLIESASGIVVSLGIDHAFVSAPYWHGPTSAPDLLARLFELADLIALETGLRIYDLQLRREHLDAEVSEEAVARYVGAGSVRPPVSVAWMSQACRSRKRSRRGA